MLEIVEGPQGFETVSLARFAQGGRWRTEALRSYRRPALIWFTKGQGRITVNGTRRGYGPHNAVFLPAGTMHGFDMLGQVFGSITFFPADPEIGLPPDALHLRIREARKQSELTALVDKLQTELDKGDAQSTRAMALVSGLIGVWLQREAEERNAGPETDDAAHRLAAAFAALVERDFRKPRNIAGYAAELGITPTHLSRVCRQTHGRPASDILSERVNFEARRLLTETSLPIKDIAQDLGFASAAYFTRSFCKLAGQTPSRFRRTAAPRRPVIA